MTITTKHWGNDDTWNNPGAIMTSTEYHDA